VNYTQVNQVLSSLAVVSEWPDTLSRRNDPNSPGGLALKLALKYGLLITAGIIAWVVIAHLLAPNPCAALHVTGPLVFFNLLEAGGIFFGIRDRNRLSRGQKQFKLGLKTGMGIAAVYGLGSCAFFLLIVARAGSRFLCVPPGAGPIPFWQLAGFAFVGQFVVALMGGLIYSTIISFFLVRNRPA
jgi:hypothetical protein